MAIVELVDGRRFEDVTLTDVQRVGDEGSRKAVAHIDGKTYPVYNSIVDGFNSVWHEQMTLETFRMLKGKKEIVEGTIESREE